MKLNASQYRHNIIPEIKRICEYRHDSDPIDIIGDLAAATGCHIVIVAQLLKEVYGDSIRLNALSIRLREFYKIDEVI